VFSASEFLRAGRIPREGLVPLLMSDAESLDIDRAADLARAERHLEGTQHA